MASKALDPWTALPPDDLARRPLPIETLVPDTLLYRICKTHRDPLWFGPADGQGPVHRFDDPERQFRVCYLGRSREAAFAETFLRRPPVRLVSRTMMDARQLATCRVQRALRLVPFSGAHLVQLGATAAVVTGPYATARIWSRAFWAHPDQPDGLLYRCRHDDDHHAVALFDRSQVCLEVGVRMGLRDDRVWFGRTLDRYGVALVD